jgi:drug/metabolite transporter (DMT)-like permease
MGVLGTVSHLCLAQALKEADVTAVLPFDFTKLIWAALFGFVFFAEVPDWGTWLGGAMIFAAVTYIAYRERRLRGKDAVPSVPAPGDGTI